MNPETLRSEITDVEAFRLAYRHDPCLDVLVALWQGRTDEAAAALRPLLAADPVNTRLLALEADVWRDRGEYGVAIDRYRRLLAGEQRPQMIATLHQHLGKVHFVAGDDELAATCFAEALTRRRQLGVSAELVESSNAALQRARERSQQARGRSAHDPAV